MTTIAEPPKVTQESLEEQFASAQISKFDRVVSGMFSMLAHMSIIVVALIIQWLPPRKLPPRADFSVQLADVGGGVEDGEAGGEGMELNSPISEGGVTEIMDAAPQEAASFEEVVSSATSLVSTASVGLPDPDQLDAPDPRAKAGRMKGTGTRPAKGFGDGEPGYPREMRWEIIFAEGSTLQSYGQQLDAFGIELGALSPLSGQITYVKNFSTKPEKREKKPGEEDKRLHFAWKKGKLTALDKKLIEQAGVSTEGKVIMHFYPPDIENMLAHIEVNYAKRAQGQIRKTRFGVRPVGKTFEFYVLDQTPLL